MGPGWTRHKVCNRRAVSTWVCNHVSGPTRTQNKGSIAFGTRVVVQYQAKILGLSVKTGEKGYNTSPTIRTFVAMTLCEYTLISVLIKGIQMHIYDR